MKRQLPIVDIAGTAFYVDVLHDELREKDDPQNTISFSEFDQEDDGYTFLYDTVAKNTPDNPTVMEPHYKWVTLPALMELDPEGIALKYDIPLSILCPDFESLSGDPDDDDDIFPDGLAFA